MVDTSLCVIELFMVLKYNEIDKLKFERNNMKIIIINGSPRKNGVTAQILHKIEKELMTKGNVEVEFVNIAELAVSPCAGCCTCYKTGHCFIKDDAESLSERIAVSDGLVIGSPTYASNISGQLKQFIDRGHFVIEQLLYEKYAICIATGENYGSGDTSKVLTKLVKYSGAKLSGKITYNLPFNSSITYVEKIEKQVKTVADNIFRDIKFQRAYRLQMFIHNIIFSFGIKPFVVKKGEDYAGVVTKWKISGVLKK